MCKAQQKLSTKECENLGFTGLALCSDCHTFAEYIKDQASLGFSTRISKFPYHEALHCRGSPLKSDDDIAQGTDTTAAAVQLMTELIRNMEKMSRAKLELQDVTGERRQLEESRNVRLPYLQAICKETFRLHPLGPLLVPHKAISNVQVNE